MKSTIDHEPIQTISMEQTGPSFTWHNVLLTNMAQLLKVKSLLTLTATAVFAYLCITGKIEGKDFMTVFMVIVSFFFGVKSKG